MNTSILLEQMHKKFEINRTKIKGSCQSGRKVVTHNSKSDLPLVKRVLSANIYNTTAIKQKDHTNSLNVHQIVFICFESKSSVVLPSAVFFLYHLCHYITYLWEHCVYYHWPASVRARSCAYDDCYRTEAGGNSFSSILDNMA